jgi:hypothetical protein
MARKPTTLVVKRILGMTEGPSKTSETDFTPETITTQSLRLEADRLERWAKSKTGKARRNGLAAAARLRAQIPKKQ